MPRDHEVKVKITGDSKSAEAAFKRVAELGDHLGHALKVGAAAAAASLAAIGTASVALGAKMLGGAGEVERYAAILETVTGSAETAQHKLEWLREFAAKTPFELPGLMEAATKLEAYGFSAEQYMQVLGDTSAALGKDVMSAVEALADATTGEFERLKEFGIKASVEGAQVAFDYVDKSGKQQRVVVDKNNREMIASTLTAIWNERYSGAMEKMSTTWEGMVSNMKDALTKALADAGADLLPVFKPVLEEIIGFLEGEEFRGVLETVAGAFADMAPVILQLFHAAAPLVDLFGQLVEKLSPVFVGLLTQLAEVVGRAADTLTRSGIVDSIARIVQAVGSEFVELLDRLLQISIPLLDLALKTVTPLVEIADKLGIIQAVIYMIIAAKVASGIQSLVKGVTDLVGGLRNIGAAAAAGASNLQSTLTSAVAGLSAPLSLTAQSVGMAIGGSIVAGVAGYGIGNAIVNAIKDWTGLADAEREAEEASARLAETESRLQEILSSRKQTVQEIADAHRQEALQRQEYVDLFTRLNSVLIAGEEEASNIAVAALYDRQAALDALQAKYIEYQRTASEATVEEVAERYRQKAQEIHSVIIEMMASGGELTTRTREAIQGLKPLPGEVVEALKSSSESARSAAQQCVNEYVSGLIAAAGLPATEAGKISAEVAQALSSSDPEVKNAAYNTIKTLIDGLVQNRGLPESKAQEIRAAIAKALSISEPQISETSSSWGKALQRIEGEMAHRLVKIIQRLVFFQIQAAKLLKLQQSPPVDVWAPEIYRRALEGIEAEFARAQFPAAPAHRLTEPAAKIAAAPGGGVTINLHVGTLISDDRSWEELARKVQYRYGPRLARAVGVV